MPFVQRIVKPKTHKGKCFLENREPKLIENCKRSIFIRGVNANNVILQALKDFASIKRPDCVLFTKKNDIKPFEDASTLEFFSQRNDASLFMFGSHNKKRPNNLVIGRTFDYRILDMFEFGLENFQSLQDFKNAKIPLGTKPVLLFSGDAFENQPDYQRLKNLLIDFFRGPLVEFVNLKGFEHVLIFAENNGKIIFRSYRATLKKSATKVPDVELEEIGPHMDMTLRRVRVATSALFKQACKKPLQLKTKKVKNIKKDDFGRTHGRIHMEKQDYKKLPTWRMKGLKRKGKMLDAQDGDEASEKKAKLEEAEGSTVSQTIAVED